MAKRIKRSFADQRELIELRRALTGTQNDVQNYLGGFSGVVKLAQDLWITFPIWMKHQVDPTSSQLPLDPDAPLDPNSLNPTYERPDAETLIADLLVLRAFHEMVLITVQQLFSTKAKLVEARKSLKVLTDIDQVTFQFANEILPVLHALPVRLSESTVGLKSIVDKYRPALMVHLPAHIYESLEGFINGADAAVQQMAVEAEAETANLEAVNLHEATTTPDTEDVPTYTPEPQDIVDQQPSE